MPDKKNHYFHGVSICCEMLTNVNSASVAVLMLDKLRQILWVLKRYRFQIERQFSSTLNFKISGKYRLSWFMRKVYFFRYNFTACAFVLCCLFPIFARIKPHKPLLFAYHHQMKLCYMKFMFFSARHYNAESQKQKVVSKTYNFNLNVFWVRNSL